ncbi:MAG: M48 family metallopeptidase [FCB group bacterium]|nr:M48 family metallopeptidase [FCB group bacterium]
MLEKTGPVLLQRSSRAKYLRITVREDCSVRVIIPRGATFRQARKFLLSKKEWVVRHLGLMKNRKNSPATGIHVPDVPDKEKAGQFLTRQLRKLSNEFDLPFNRVTFRSQKTIWGSCSHENNISLNYKLSLLPGHLRNYVLAHELVHTVIKNHSPIFWASLEAKVEGAGDLRRELRNYRLR